MARIAGVTIPSDKRVVIALTYIRGVGQSTSEKVLKDLNIDGSIRTKDLTEDQVKQIRTAVETDRRLEGDLQRDKLSDIKRLKEIGS